MKAERILWLASLWCALASSAAVAVEPPPSPADIPAIMAAAATYESGGNLAPLRRIEELVRVAARDLTVRQRLEAGLAALIATNATYEARRFACLQLAVVGSDASVATLAGLLPNDETVGLSCYALSTHPSPRAGEALRQALATARGVARVHIINALGSRRDTAAAAALSKLSADVDVAVAQAAIAALGKIGDGPARQAIAELRRASNPALASALVEASLRVAERLAAAGDRPAAIAAYEAMLPQTQPSHARRGALGALLRLDADGGERRILDVLRANDPVLKPVALAAIRSLRSRDASAKFAAELPALQPREQVWLIEALAERNDTGARSAVEAQLANSDPSVRLAAIAAVGRVSDSGGVPLLARTLATANEPVERQALESALANLRGGQETDRAITAELRSANAGAKCCLLAALARRGSNAAVPAVLVETGSSDAAVAGAAFKALASLASGDDLPALLQQLIGLKANAARQQAEATLVLVLGKVPDAAFRAPLVGQALDRTSDLEAQCSLLRLLPACGGPTALAALQAKCRDADPRLRETAIRALSEWPDATAWESLAELYRRSDKESHQTLALRGLARLADEENARPSALLLERYRQLLADARSDEHRRLILGAVSGLAHPNALPLVFPLLANAGVRAEAAQAVRKIAEAIKANHPQAAQEALQKLK